MVAKRRGRLTLTRKSGEGLTIGDDVEVTIRKLSERHVTLEIVAPVDRKILRKELGPVLAQDTESLAVPRHGQPPAHRRV